MRSTGLAPLLLVMMTACSGPTGPTTAAITVRAPASLPAHLCTRCNGIPGELEAVTDLVVQETAGVAVEVTSVDVLFSNASMTIDGPFEVDSPRLGVSDPRIAARGTLTIPDIGTHFSGSLRNQLPANLRFTVKARDANNNRIQSEVSVVITAP